MWWAAQPTWPPPPRPGSRASADIARGSFVGRNFHFGVREHGMGSILNGMALYGGFIPFGATFLVFADYMRPPIRLANIMGVQVDLCLHPRQHLCGRGRSHARAGGADRLAALDPGDDGDPPGRRPGGGRRLGLCPAPSAWPHRADPDPPERARPSRGRRPSPSQAFNRGAYTVAETPGKAPDVVLVGTGSELQFGRGGQGRAGGGRLCGARRLHALARALPAAGRGFPPGLDPGGAPARW